MSIPSNPAKNNLLLSLLLVFIPVAVILCVYLSLDIFKPQSKKMVYVDLESILQDSPDFFVLKDFDDNFSVSFEKIEEPRMDLKDIVLKHDMPASSTEIETKIYKKAMESQKELIANINDTLKKSAQISRERNINIGLMQLRPIINEYKSFIHTQMQQDLSSNFRENTQVFLKLVSASNYYAIFPDNDFANEVDNFSSELSFVKNRNTMIFQHYFDMSELFVTQETNELINSINAETSDYMNYRKDAADKKYEKSINDIKTLLEQDMISVLNVPSDSDIVPKYETIDIPNHSSMDNKSITSDLKYLSNDLILSNLRNIIFNMANDMNLSITFEKESDDTPDYTNIFKKKLHEDSWKYSHCIISDLGG